MKPVQIPSFMSIGTTVFELRKFEEKKNKMDKMRIISLALIRRGNGISVKYFYAIKVSEIELN